MPNLRRLIYEWRKEGVKLGKRFETIMAKNRWKLHPQPSSEKKAYKALQRFEEEYTPIRGKYVLDPYCGTGTLVFIAKDYGAYAIGSDIEDWSAYLRRRWSRDQENPRFVWGLDAVEAVRAFLPDIIFMDPPNPRKLLGGRYPSAYRDTGIRGDELRKYWEDKLNSKNVMGSRSAVDHLRGVILAAYRYGVSYVIVNIFDKLLETALKDFVVSDLYKTYKVVMLWAPANRPALSHAPSSQEGTAGVGPRGMDECPESGEMNAPPVEEAEASSPLGEVRTGGGTGGTGLRR